MNYCIFCMEPLNDTAECCPHCGKAQRITAPAHHLKPGTRLAGRYLVGCALGEGGFGITYLGRDEKLDMHVAVKEYYPKGYANRANTVSAKVECAAEGENRAVFEKGRERFLREARSLAKFSGEAGIVDVRDFFEENNTAYIVMEYLEGETLAAYLKRKGKLTMQESLDLLLPVMRSLQKIHTQGIIHRDISPDNIMLASGRVKLLDFGAARSVSGAENRSLSVVLKPGYAPEEQYRSKGEQGPWTDVYALCATIYRCITGVTPDDAAQRVFSDDLKAPSTLGASISPAQERALLKGMALYRKDRWQSVDEMLNAIQSTHPEADEDCTVYVPAARAGARAVEAETPKAPVPLHREAPPVSRTVKPKEPAALSKPEISHKAADAPKPKKPKNKKRFGMVLLVAVLGLVAVVGLVTVFRALGSKTVAGKKIDRDETNVYLSGVTLTEKDTRTLASLGKLEEITFVRCSFEDGAFANLCGIASYFTRLKLSECTGITDYTALSKLSYLGELEIVNCGLTDAQLAQVDLSGNQYLANIDFSENAQLSDLTPLSARADSLVKLTVDKTSVRDFSALKDCGKLVSVSARECGITSLESLTNQTIVSLDIEDNAIPDLSPLQGFSLLATLDANNNQITDLSPLAGHEPLISLHVANNQITDLSPLAETPYLVSLSVADNDIESLLPLAGCKLLRAVSVQNNRLTSLTGLEEALELAFLRAEGNQITDLDGIANCTVLYVANLNDNALTNIDVLGKSAATLRYVFFDNNQVENIDALADTPELQYLSFDNNLVTTLAPLAHSTELVGISADNNRIVSIGALGNAQKLRYVFLPHNEISDMSVIGNLKPTDSSFDKIIVDLSSNRISDVRVAEGKRFEYLALYNNPISSFMGIEQAKGEYLLFSYTENAEFSTLGETFYTFKVVDCPLDKQVGVRDTLVGKYSIRAVVFQTTEEADQATVDLKNDFLRGKVEE